MDAGNGVRLRHAVQGAKSSSRGWSMVGVGDVQVDSVLNREIRWGSGTTKKGSTTTIGYWWGGR